MVVFILVAFLDPVAGACTLGPALQSTLLPVLTALGAIDNAASPLYRFNETQLCCDAGGAIGCDAANANFVSLRLEGYGLSGTISGDLGLFTALTLLSLSNNALTGTIPVEFGRLLYLTSLFLDGNKLTGAVPVIPLQGSANCSLESESLPGNCLNLSTSLCKANGGPCRCDAVGARCGTPSSSAAPASVTTVKGVGKTSAASTFGSLFTASLVTAGIVVAYVF